MRIVSDLDEVASFVGQAREAADTAKKALGFLPGAVFGEAASQGKLLIALVHRNDIALYAGHLLHGGVYPRAKIFQVFISPEFRRHGIGRRLVEALIRRAEDEQFMSVSARVADDLEANGFWKRLGFEVIRTSEGGRSRGRRINIRIRELNTPNLFRPTLVSTIGSASSLNLRSRLFDVSPIYVLDLNVLFDLLRRRANADDVGQIVRASLNNLIRLAVTDEFIKELERNSKPSPTDPVLQLALNLPQLPSPSSEILRGTVAELQELIFSGESATGKLRIQDQSDLVHLATAIHYRASGFITSEKAILRARQNLLAKYSMEVVGPSELAGIVEPADFPQERTVRALSEGREVRARPVQAGDLPLVEQFLGRMRCPPQLAREAIEADPTRPRCRAVVLCGESLVGFGSWDVPSEIRPLVRAFICVDEDQSAVGLAADFLLDSAAKASTTGFPVQVSLRLLPGHVTTRRIAAVHGFRASAEDPTNVSHLQKIALGCALTEKNWGLLRHKLERRAGIGLPASIPTYKSLDQVVPLASPTGEPQYVPLKELETLLSPAILLLPGRPGAIVPIRRVYADDLIGGSKQQKLLSSPEAVMLHERVYFSDPRTRRILVRGTPVLFYESARNGGSASVTAIARIARAELLSKEGADQELLRRGVLDRKGLEKICLADKVAASTIDSVMLFSNPVPLARLRELGAVGRANLVTAQELASEQITRIVEEGMS